MMFASPWAFALAGLMIPVIALYFLKLKRKRVPIPSTWLWMRSINDLRVNAPFQRLRKNLLLLLQLLLIAAATLALTGPLGRSQPTDFKVWVLLIDRSASMGMTDVAPSRLDAAKDQARAAIRSMAEQDQVMIVTFARHPQVLLPATRDRVEAERALDGITPSETSTRVTEAFQVAVSKAVGFPRSEILLLSDGEFEAIAVPTERVPVTFIPIGAKPHNAAITALQVRAPRESADPWTIFVHVDLFSDKPAEVPIELYVNGGLKDARRIPMAPQESRAVIFEVTQPVPNIVEARLAFPDDLTADNRAWQVVQHQQPKVLLISAGNYFLDQALAKIPDIEVFRVRPEMIVGVKPEAYDAVVCDGKLPTSVPEGRYLFLNCLPAWEGFEMAGEMKEPPVVDWFRRHPVTRDITFAGITIQKASRLKLPEFAQPLVETTDSTLIAGWERGETRAVIVAFDILDTDWPLRLSYPLFITNCVEWLTRTGGDVWQAQPKTGDSFQIRFGAGETQVSVASPGGATYAFDGEPGTTRSFAETEKAGLYTIKRAAGSESVALNLMDPRESAGRVAESVEIDDEKVTGDRSVPAPPTEWWKWIAWGVLALLLIEWFVYHRRIEF